MKNCTCLTERLDETIDLKEDQKLIFQGSSSLKLRFKEFCGWGLHFLGQQPREIHLF